MPVSSGKAIQMVLYVTRSSVSAEGSRPCRSARRHSSIKYSKEAKIPVTMPLIDLGAEVIKVEPPAGDYIREMTWPIVEGVSLMHLHLNRGKRSIVMDLRQPEDVATFKELVKTADIVVEAMRPGGLARRGVGFDDLRIINPKIVFCTISGYGMTGPYRT